MRIAGMSRTASIYISSILFFNNTATTEIYTLSLHDALPISRHSCRIGWYAMALMVKSRRARLSTPRSEEHTSELQSHVNLVCRLLLEKKKRPWPIFRTAFRKKDVPPLFGCLVGRAFFVLFLL